MPYLEDGTVATKARNVLQSQLTLRQMRRHPERIKQVTIDNVGRVSVEWKDAPPEPIGLLNLQYWKDFKRMVVREFTVTGGVAMNERCRIFENHTETPLTYFGCNLIIDTVKNG